MQVETKDQKYSSLRKSSVTCCCVMSRLSPDLEMKYQTTVPRHSVSIAWENRGYLNDLWVLFSVDMRT